MSWAEKQAAVQKHFRMQSVVCRRLGSPFTSTLLARIAATLDDHRALADRLYNWPGDVDDDAVALRVAAACHALSLSGTIPALHELPDDALNNEIAAVLDNHRDFILHTINHPPQTNEVARAAVLTPGFLALAGIVQQPLALYEIGASAGLNQYWHHWRYDFGGAGWGDPNAAIALAPDWSGAAPPLGDVALGTIQGADIRPIDICDADEQNRLCSYIWPDQTARLHRLKTAIDHARRHPPTIARQDAGAWLDAVLPNRKANCCAVVFHSVVWQYLPKASQARCLAAMQSNASPSSPIAWLRMEPEPQRKHCELKLDLWPHGQSWHLADAHFHGQWVRWYGLDRHG